MYLALVTRNLTLLHRECVLVTLFLLTLQAHSAYGHGCALGISVNNGTYQNAYNCQDPQSGAGNFTRAYNTDTPIYGLGFNSTAYGIPNDAITCSTFNGEPAQPAVGTLAVNAGDQLKIFYSPWDVNIALYHYGPIVAYMAGCNGDCSTFDGSNTASWFKVWQSGWLPDDSMWATQYMGLVNNSTFTFSLPSQLPSGQYLLRLELVSLQFSAAPVALRGTQVYPSCHQLDLTAVSDMTCLPNDGEMMAFPGAYDPDSESFTYNIWNTPWPVDYSVRTDVQGYVMPGGPLWQPSCGPPLTPSTTGALTAGSGDMGPSPSSSVQTSTEESLIEERKSKEQAIIGGICGGLGGLILILLLLWLCCCRGRSQEDKQTAETEKVLLAAAILQKRRESDQDAASVCDQDAFVISKPSSSAAHCGVTDWPYGAYTHELPHHVHSYAGSSAGWPGVEHPPTHSSPSLYSGIARSFAYPASQSLYNPHTTHLHPATLPMNHSPRAHYRSRSDVGASERIPCRPPLTGRSISTSNLGGTRYAPSEGPSHYSSSQAGISRYPDEETRYYHQ